MKTKPPKKPPAKQPYILPRIPSQLIEIALEDLEKCERSKRYVVDMGAWHQPRDGACVVCAAGAVIAKSLNVPPTRYTSPSCHPGNKDQLSAIDLLRSGHIGRACYELEIRTPNTLPSFIPVTSYQYNPRDFKRDLRRLAKTLKEAGI